MPGPKVFLSFASQDRTFSRRLLARLRAQPVEVWDYSREDEEIPPGVHVMDYLRQRIEAVDVFVPVVSPNAFASSYTRGEVEHALGLRARGGPLVVPIRLRRCVWPSGMAVAFPDPLDNAWPAPYEELRKIRFFEAAVGFFSPGEQVQALTGLDPIAQLEPMRKIGAEERDSLEQLLCDFCRALEIPYSPLYLGDPRLPLLQRFEAELGTIAIDGSDMKHSQNARATYARLCNTRAELGAMLEGGDFERALNCINYFIAICEYEVPQRLYYPYIVKAVCLMAGGQLPAAMDALLPLLNHPLADESLFSALGVIHHQKGHYADACMWYERADKAASNRNILDPAAKHGILYNALLCGASADIDLLLRQIETAGVPRVHDQLKVRALKAFAYTQLGRFREALVVYQEILRGQMIDADLLMNYADLLCRPDTPISNPQKALSLLEEHADQFGRVGSYRDRLVMLNRQCGHLERSLQHARLLLVEHPTTRRYWTHAAGVFYEANESAEAARLAWTILDRTRFGLPVLPEDFYCDGLANWILGRSERARYDFERSGKSPEYDYPRVLPLHNKYSGYNGRLEG